MSIQAMSWVWDQAIPPNGKIVLLAIADHAGADGGDAWPSIARLARMTGYSSRQIQRIVGELVRHGVLRIEDPGGRVDGKNRPARYRVMMRSPVMVDRAEFTTGGASPELRQEVIAAFAATCHWCQQEGTQETGPDGHPWEVDRLRTARQGGVYERTNVVLACRKCNRARGDILTPPGATPMSGRGDTHVAGGATPMSPEPSIEPTTEPNTADSLRSPVSVLPLGLDEQETSEVQNFLRFWNAYPRRVGKGQARKAWKSARKKADAETIIAGADRYANDPNRKPEFTAHPSTWLNGERWTDEPIRPTRADRFMSSDRVATGGRQDDSIFT